MAWNVFQHFYPYFDVVSNDWPGALSRGLQSAATDATVEDFERTLNRLVAELKDGHGRVVPQRRTETRRAPLSFAWVDNQLLVSRVRKQAESSVAAGDRVLSIDGKPFEQWSAEVRPLISSATEQWMQVRMIETISRCQGLSIRLELEPFGKAERKAVELACEAIQSKDPDAYPERRPEAFAELAGGIVYIDLGRIEQAAYQKAVPQIEKAPALVFDMRGYPNQVAMSVLGSLSRDTVRSAKMDIPI